MAQVSGFTRSLGRNRVERHHSRAIGKPARLDHSDGPQVIVEQEDRTIRKNERSVRATCHRERSNLSCNATRRSAWAVPRASHTVERILGCWRGLSCADSAACVMLMGENKTIKDRRGSIDSSEWHWLAKPKTNVISKFRVHKTDTEVARGAGSDPQPAYFGVNRAIIQVAQKRSSFSAGVCCRWWRAAPAVIGLPAQPQPGTAIRL